MMPTLSAHWHKEIFRGLSVLLRVELGKLILRKLRGEQGESNSNNKNTESQEKQGMALTRKLMPGSCKALKHVCRPIASNFKHVSRRIAFKTAALLD